MTKKVVAQGPPEHIRKQQQESASVSMDAMTANKSMEPNNEDDLFAVALGPRSPDDTKSPFSFSSAEIGAFAKIKGPER
jgi:hypothetical protein